jgi:hypothetical protein
LTGLFNANTKRQRAISSEGKEFIRKQTAQTFHLLAMAKQHYEIGALKKTETLHHATWYSTDKTL